MTVLRRGDRHERGSALVEAALVLPVLLALLFAVVEFSIVMNDWNSVRQGSREGARQAAVYTTGGDSSCSLIGSSAPNTVTHEFVCLVKDRTQLGTDTRVMLGFSDTDGDGSMTDADYVVGDGSVIVCVQYPISSASGFFASVLDGKAVTSKTEFRIEDVSDVALGEEPFRLHEETPFTDWASCT